MNRLVLAAAVAVAATVVGTTVETSATHAEDDLPGQLREVLADEVTAFEVVEIDVASLAEGLETGKATVPVVNDAGELVDVTMPAVPSTLREEGVTVGMLRSGDGKARRVPLPPERAYRLGDCPSTDSCGTATILDDRSTMVSGLVITAQGVSWYEPVNLLLGTDQYPNLHVVYSDARTLDFVVDDETSMLDRDHDVDRPGTEPDDDSPAYSGPRFVKRATKIVLDGDRTFFNASPATVFSRQLAIFNDLSLMYEFIEPLSTEKPETARWSLDLTVKGQEVWTAGGPTTTDKVALTNELTAPGYHLVNQVTDDEIHLFFVGYDVTDVLGRAAGIGTPAGGLGGAAGRNHVYVEARTGQTAKSKWVVSAHEVGHLIGGTHDAGVPDTCSNLALFFATIPICGVSIMAAGGVASPDARAAYFTDANDAEIALVLMMTLP